MNYHYHNYYHYVFLEVSILCICTAIDSLMLPCTIKLTCTNILLTLNVFLWYRPQYSHGMLKDMTGIKRMVYRIYNFLCNFQNIL